MQIDQYNDPISVLDTPQIANLQQEPAPQDLELVKVQNSECSDELESRLQKLLKLPKINSQEFQKHISEEEFKIQSLNDNLDDLFSRISKLTEQIVSQNQNPGFNGQNTLNHNEQKSIENFCVQKTNIACSSSPPEYRSQVLLGQSISERVQSEDSKIRQQKSFDASSNHLPVIPIQSRALPEKGISMRMFQLGNSIGQGKYGQVSQLLHIETGSLYAVKKIFKSTVLHEYAMQDQFLQELRIHASLEHPNIVRLYNCWTDEYHIFMLLEYIPGKTLEKFFKSDQRFVSRVTFQLLKTLQYLHSIYIVHRDIKPENIIYTHQTIKLCDFGWACSFKDSLPQTFCGTLDYVSPQVVSKMPYDGSVDVWSVGVLVFELLSGTVPFKDSNKQVHLQNILNCDKDNSIVWPSQLSAEARDFVKGLLKRDPLSRMSIQQCLRHAFIKKYETQQGVNHEISFNIQQQ